MKFIGVLDSLMKDKISQFHNELIQKLSAYPQINKIDANLVVDFSSTLAVTAGKAFSHRNLIKLNHRLLSRNEDHLLTTYGHELMHLLASAIYSHRIGHGAEWKRLMVQIGLTPDRCHNLDTSEFKQKSRKIYVYSCRCPNEIKVGLLVHKKIQKGIVYRCRQCKSPLAVKSKSLFSEVNVHALSGV